IRQGQEGRRRGGGPAVAGGEGWRLASPPRAVLLEGQPSPDPFWRLQAPAGSGARGRIRAPTAGSSGDEYDCDDFCDFVLCPNDCKCEVILFFGQMNVIVMIFV
ncbi:Os04g0426266, partial [Oryza sativa Japonica Group]